MLDSHANRIHGDDIIKGPEVDGAPSKGLMNRALSEFESPRRDRIKRLLVGAPRSVLEAHFPESASLGSKRERRAQESR